MQQKLFFCDVETTGTNPEVHQLWSLDGEIVIDGALKDRVSIRSSLFQGVEVDEIALETSNITKEEIVNYDHPTNCYMMLSNNLSNRINKYDKQDKAFFVAYNATFDMDFTRSFFERAGDNYFHSYFFWPAIDVAQLALMALWRRRHAMPNFKQNTVAKELGFDVDESKLHESGYDLSLLKAIFYKTLEIITFRKNPVS